MQSVGLFDRQWATFQIPAGRNRLHKSHDHVWGRTILNWMKRNLTYLHRHYSYSEPADFETAFIAAEPVPSASTR